MKTKKEKELEKEVAGLQDALIRTRELWQNTCGENRGLRNRITELEEKNQKLLEKIDYLDRIDLKRLHESMADAEKIRDLEEKLRMSHAVDWDMSNRRSEAFAHLAQKLEDEGGYSKMLEGTLDLAEKECRELKGKLAEAEAETLRWVGYVKGVDSLLVDVWKSRKYHSCPGRNCGKTQANAANIHVNVNGLKWGLNEWAQTVDEEIGEIKDEMVELSKKLRANINELWGRDPSVGRLPLSEWTERVIDRLDRLENQVQGNYDREEHDMFRDAVKRRVEALEDKEKTFAEKYFKKD